MIIPVALIIVLLFTSTTPAALSEDGKDKVIVNISSTSGMLSRLTGIFAVVLLVPATIVTVCIVELKSVLLPIKGNTKHFASIQ